jgi:hypothetical protein
VESIGNTEVTKNAYEDEKHLKMSLSDNCTMAPISSLYARGSL